MSLVDTSGPPYPSLPAAGSNAIGELAIGESQIGDISPFDWRATIISQYANSEILTGIIQSFFQAADQTQNLDAFYDDIWNLDTAQGYGLDVWGRIVGVNRILEIAIGGWFGFAEANAESWNTAGVYVVQPYLGFAEALLTTFTPNTGDENQDFSGDLNVLASQPFQFPSPYVQSFDHGIFGLNETYVPSLLPIGGAFYSGDGLTTSYSLSDQSYRLLIYAKAAANISNGSIPAINQMLMNLFPNRGNCYVSDGQAVTNYFGFAEAPTSETFGQGEFYNGEVALTMSMQYVFRFPLTAVELAIVQQSGVLPKPVGVQVSTLIQPL